MLEPDENSLKCSVSAVFILDMEEMSAVHFRSFPGLLHSSDIRGILKRVRQESI